MPIGTSDGQHFEDEWQHAVASFQPSVDKPYDSNFNTRLSPEEETPFADWKQKYAPNDSGEDYDLRGAFQAGVTPDPNTGHMPDTWKKPNHPTFSDQSQYAIEAPDRAGSWQGEIYIPPKGPFQLKEILPFNPEPLKKPTPLKKMTPLEQIEVV